MKALSCFPGVTINEVLDQQGNVFSSFSQCRDFNRKDVEPVKQVAPEHTRSDGSLQIAVSGSNHSKIGLDGSSSTDTFEFVFLQNTQERDLGPGTNRSDPVNANASSLHRL